MQDIGMLDGNGSPIASQRSPVATPESSLLMSATPPRISACADSPLLAIRGLGRRFSERWVWREVQFDLSSKERLGLVGPSGSGKTVLLRTLAGLDRIRVGTIAFGDRPLLQWSLPAYRAKVAYVPQQSALFEGTVERNLQLVFDLSVHARRSYDRSAVLSDLATFERDEEFLSLDASQLSGGERQIVCLLRILQLEPQVLLLDEPTASLDPDSSRAAEALVERWIARGDRACIWTSHDREQLERVTNRQLLLQDFQA
ncbi:MAG: ATP-binding cassette domain-containing protein [Cyanobacteria bacterium J06639_1]